MDKNFTLSGKCILITVVTFLSSFIQAQTITGVLPLTYQTLNAAVINNTVNLFWITGAETTNHHFKVERSFDQTNFSTVGIISGAQTNNGISYQFSFKDGAPELLRHKVIYYRLEQVDDDGKFSYSVVKMVRINAVTKAFIQISPNPYLDKLNVNFVSDTSGNAAVRLISASGNLVKLTTSSIAKGYNNIQLQDLRSQAPGLYTANIIINDKVVASLRVLKL